MDERRRAHFDRDQRCDCQRWVARFGRQFLARSNLLTASRLTIGERTPHTAARPTVSP